MTRQAVRFQTAAGAVRIGRLDGTTIHDAGAGGPQGFVPDRDGWATIDAAAGAVYDIASVTLLAPVCPTKVICIGLNYRDHAEESALDIPTVPVVFAKWPSSLVGHEAPIILPREETRPDYEGELAVVFARRFSRASPAEARSLVGGYCAFNDVSGRRAQLETPLRQFTLGKSFDLFGPIGPCLVDADGVDLGNVDVSTRVSGEVLQSSNTRNLIFGIETLIEYISAATTIEAGDVLITGTPGGVGDSRTPPRYLVPGDVVEVSVTGCPTLRNPVVAEH
jgi:2-keto-4-pentenoate hydratase/2-oxohepta-3-ene-1,7-dioic acid hydratase in catechol pathway